MIGVGLGLARGVFSVPPVLSSLDPPFGSTAGDTVPHVLAGFGFSGVAASGAVTIGGAACTYTVDSDTQITITATPARSAGLHDVAVTRSGVAGTLSNGYRAIAFRLMLDAYLGRTLNGSTVSQWGDQSGNALHVSQGTASAQPTYNATGLNSRPTLVFDGGDALRNTVSNLVTNAGGAATIFFVGRSDTNAGGSIVTRRLSTVYQSAQMLLGGNAFINGDGSSGTANVYVDNFTGFRSPFYSTHIYNGAGASMGFRLNGVAKDATGNARTQTTENGTTGFEVGQNAATQRWNGAFSALFVADGALAAGVITEVETWLKSRWGL